MYVCMSATDLDRASFIRENRAVLQSRFTFVDFRFRMVSVKNYKAMVASCSAVRALSHDALFLSREDMSWHPLKINYEEPCQQHGFPLLYPGQKTKDTHFLKCFIMTSYAWS